MAGPLNINMAKQAAGLGQAATGIAPPRSFALDASVSAYKEQHAIIREDVRQNKIRFRFPGGLNKLDLMEECRALTQLDDFDMMFDITMQMLTGKPLQITMYNEQGQEIVVAELQITDQYQNLRGNDFIDQYPIVVTWLVEWIGDYLSKKYPTPGSVQSVPAQSSSPVPEPKKMRVKPFKMEQAP
jgi:hypothetical protein